MNYPDNYKVQTMFISKFERDFNSQIDYQFINAFPKLVTAIPVSYGAADLLKVSVQFTYDRYIVNPRGSIRKSNSSGFNDITRVANNSTISDQEIQGLIADYGGEGSDRLTREQAAAMLSGKGVETVFEPTAPAAALERPAGSQAQVINSDPFSPTGQSSEVPNTSAQNKQFEIEWNRKYNSDGTLKRTGGPGAEKVRQVQEGW